MMNKRPNHRWYIGGFYLFLLGFWQLFVSLGFIPDYLLPSPLEVIKRITELCTEGRLLPSIMATISRMAIGYLFAAAIGLALGFGMGTNDRISSCIKSLFLGLQTLPTAAWVPLSLIFFGLSDKAIYFVIVMSAVPVVAISTADSIRNIPPIYIRAALTLGTPWWLMPTRVIIPAALPGIVTGIKLGWTMGWHGAVSAELIKSSVGLGFLLHMGRELSDAPQVIGIMLVTIFIGSMLDHFLFGVIERKIRRRWGLESA